MEKQSQDSLAENETWQNRDPVRVVTVKYQSILLKDCALNACSNKH
jgi:hypothetical protein